jgi:hypothetical protein
MAQTVADTKLGTEHILDALVAEGLFAPNALARCGRTRQVGDGRQGRVSGYAER